MSNSIHPDEYQRRSTARQRERDELHRLDNEDYARAAKCPVPANLRPALPTDIVVGAIIWYPARSGDQDPDAYGPQPWWEIVAEVRYPDDAFKAYTAEDGCRYGLEGAFVEVR